MKKSLYIRICNKVLGMFFLLMPFLYSATSLAGITSLKTDFESSRPAYTTVSIYSPAVMLYHPVISTPDTSLLSLEGSSQYSLNNLLKKNSNYNYIPGKAMAAPPTIVCPGNITSNTDPGLCTASKSGIAATINDTDGDITTLTWTMTGATIAASPISGINNISGSYLFNKGITTVTYRVTDAGGSTVSCSFTVTVTDNQIPLITCPPNQTLPIPSCATITDPISFSLLSVSDNCGILNFSSNAPAQYPLGITTVLWTANDISGNSAQCTQTVSVINEAAMNLTGTSAPISCFGGSDGTATVGISGGSPAYTYSWNTVPVQTTSTATNLLPGSYTVTVTDFYGCTGTTSVTVSQPAAPLSVSVDSLVNVACFGSSTGSITLAGNGGTPVYQYSIDGVNFQVSATFPDLAAGTYTLTIRDSKNCENTTSASLTQPATAVTGTISSQSNVACIGTATGSVTVAGSGGMPPYQYNINGGLFQAGGTFGSLSAGTYSILVKDANNCTTVVPVTITQSATAFSASITSSTKVLCFGQSNGTATVTATGGTTPYTYSWNTIPVQTTATAINLAAQNYTVTAIDANGCKVTANITITQPAPLVVTISKTNVACFSDSTGTATAVASGGTPPYTYAWLTVPIQTTATVSNLPAGTYTVAVFDSLGCFKPAFVTITQPAAKLIASITQVNVDCAGNNTGSITVTGSGGVAPILYNINGGTFQASGTFNSLTAGNYTIIARDANNCTVTVPATITAPASPLIASIPSQTNVLCSGQANGSATATATGGTSPYTYSWNSVPVQTAAVAINLTARNYTVTVTDAAGCKTTANATITSPAPLVVAITKTDISCFGDSTGSATALASGGTPPYTYAWLTVPIQTTATVSNLPAGTYTVAVFDSLGCFKPAFVTITQPATKIIASITNQEIVVCGGNTGSLTVSGSGGIPPYQYNINGGAFQTSGIFDSLSAGVYSITVRDANNCTFDLPATITEPADALKASISSHTNVLCAGQATGSATGAATDGTAPYSYSWNTIPVQTTETINTLAAGSYIVTITDFSGCVARDTAFITEPPILAVSIINQVNYDCATGTNGSVTVAGEGGTPGYQYRIDGGPYQVSGTFANLAVGNYIITVKDANNCETPFTAEILVSGLIQAANDTFTTPEDTPLNDNVMNNDQVACNLPITVTSNTSPLNGSVSVNPDGSFTYSPSLNSNGTDSFTYTITDSAGDTSTATVFITINPVNDPPVTLNDSVIVNYNLPTSDNLLLNGHYDPDGTILNVTTTPILDPVNGTFIVAADGSFTYTPDLNFIGTDIIIISICDAGIPLPAACTNDTIFINVLKPNLPPVIVNENITACQDGSFTGSLTNGGGVFNGDTDPENNLPLTLNIIPVQDAAHGVFTITDVVAGTFDYTPNIGYSGPDFAVVSICDSGIPVKCSNDTIYIEVQEQAVAFAGADTTMCAGNTIRLNQASALNFSTLLWVVDPDTSGTISDPLALNPTFTPASGFSGTATLTLSAKGNGACSDAEVFDVINIIVNSPLIADAGDDQPIVPGSVTILSGSVSGGSGFYAWNWQPSELLSNPTDEDPITVALNATTTFTLTVLDIITGCTDDDSVEIMVDNEINTIVAVADHDTTLINASVNFDVLDNDQNPDNYLITVSICGYPAHGLVIINSDNTITYTPYSDYEGDDEFCYRICSSVNAALCSDATVFVNVKKPGLNDLFAYSGLSPNDDKLNDVWKIRGIEKYPDNTVIIFNRWGDKLREFAGYNNTTNSWDGKNENGDHLPDGTYFYILDVKNIGELKGWIFIRGK